MALERATVHRLAVPMAGSFASAHHRNFREMASTLVMLEGDGAVGLGTADATPGYSVQTHDEIVASLRDDLLPRVLAADPPNPNQFLDILAEVPDAPNAKCALEVAFLDWDGRRTDRAVVDSLCGARRTDIPLNGWVGIDDPEIMAEDARRWRDEGYTSLKIKLSGDADVDVERVAAVCAAVADDGVAVRADVNAGYDVETAIEVAQAIEAYPVTHLEQPVAKDDLDGLARVTSNTSTPIMADEAIVTPGDAYEVLRRGAADRIKVKILRMGGVLPTRAVLDAAALAGVSAVLGHGFGLVPATSAELALAAAHDNVFGPLESVGPLKMTDEPFSPIDIADGHATLPNGPGLGVTLDRARLSELTTERIVVD